MVGVPSGVYIQSVGAKKYLGNTFSVKIRPVTIITNFLEPTTPVVLHPLLLLKQSVETPDLPPGFLLLDGPNVCSGAKESFSIEIDLGATKYECTYDIYETGKYALATSGYLRVGNTETIIYKNRSDTPLDNFASAMEYGPFLYWKTLGGTDNNVSILENILRQIRSIIHVPERGEIYLEDLWDTQEMKEPYDFPGTFSRCAYKLLNAWIRYEENKAREVEEHMSEILSDSIKLRENWQKHEGGFHALLPVVVAAMVSRPSQIVCVEYPEMHLYPSAQKRLLAFLAQTAQRGTVFILTTHSDAILSCARSTIPENNLSIVDGATSR